jgi:hypothetical protein
MTTMVPVEVAIPRQLLKQERQMKHARQNNNHYLN